MMIRPLAWCFNPRLRAGGDPGQAAQAGRGKGFNPRLRAGGDLPHTTQGFVSGQRFNPRLRAGGDGRCEGSKQRRYHVSTHASAREATDSMRVRYYRMSVSTHASAREATWYPILRGVLGCGFNPRLRAGGDPYRADGAGRCEGFNPRLRAGGDFISVSRMEPILRFNPRLRAGGDQSCDDDDTDSEAVSTHASAREATAR